LATKCSWRRRDEKRVEESIEEVSERSGREKEGECMSAGNKTREKRIKAARGDSEGCKVGNQASRREQKGERNKLVGKCVRARL